MELELKLTELLDINQENGTINFRGNRMLIFQSDALCELRKEMINTMGEDIVRGMLARFGYSCGFNDVTTFRNYFEFENDADLLLAGPLMHTLEGIVHASTEILEYDRQKGNFLMQGVWRNSYEAEHHLRLFGPAKEPVCWTISGYASGFATGFLGRHVICVETMCQGKGDPHCRFELRTIEDWDGAASRNIDDIKQCLVIRGPQRTVEEERETFNLWRGMSNTELECANEKLQEKVSELYRVNKLLNQEKTAMQKSTDIHNQLTSLVLDGQGLSGITSNLAQMIDKAVLVADRFFQVVAYSKPFRESDEDIALIWRKAIMDPAACKDLVTRDSRTNFFRLELTGPAEDAKDMVVVPVLAGNNYLGFVAALAEDPLNRPDCIALEHAATVTALEMLKQKAAFETELRLRKEFFEELFAGKFENEDIILWRANQLGLDLSRTYRLMTIENISEEAAHDVKKQSGQLCMSEGFFEAVDHALESVCSGFFLSCSRQSIIGLLPVTEDMGVNDKELSGVLRELESELKIHLPECRWLVGIGSPRSRLKDFVASYQEACSTIEIAKTLNCKNRCLAYEKLGIFSLININGDHFREFIRKVIGPLIEYDEKNKSQLVDTLKLYFNNNCNLQRSARNGFLNSTTMKYRLRRIKEIANIDLTNPETILLVHLALKLIEGI